MSARRAFGERLRRQRERQKVTLAEIAEATKVAGSLFAGLERGDCSRWPGGMYDRSFIRGYAKAVGLDPAETAAEFAEYYDAPPEQVEGKPIKAPQPTSPAAPLRLVIEIDPVARRNRALKLAALIVLDLLTIVALATVLVLTTSANYWLALAASSVGYQVLSRILGAVFWNGRLKPQPAGSILELGSPLAGDGDTAPVTGTASTIA